MKTRIEPPVEFDSSRSVLDCASPLALSHPLEFPFLILILILILISGYQASAQSPTNKPLTSLIRLTSIQGSDLLYFVSGAGTSNAQGAAITAQNLVNSLGGLAASNGFGNYFLGNFYIGTNSANPGYFYVGTNSTIFVQAGGGITLNGDDPTLRAEMFLHGTNAYVRFDEDAAIQDSTGTVNWKFNRFDPMTNQVARLYDLAHYKTGALTTNSTTYLIDLAARLQTNLFLCATSQAANITLRFTNTIAGAWANVSILGPAGSNAVSYVWPPGTTARWPTDPLTDLPVTNNYVRTNCFLELSVQCYATNEVRVAGHLFK